MFSPSNVPFWTAVAALAGVGQVLLLSVTAWFVYGYLRETERMRKAAESQVAKSQELVEAAQRQLDAGLDQVKASRSQVSASLEQLAAMREQAAIAADQLETQTRPAVVARVTQNGIELLNIGNGPALHVKMSGVLKGAGPQFGQAPMAHDGIPFLAAGLANALQTVIQLQLNPRFPAAPYLGGFTLQCEYKSLSGRTYATLIDFEGQRACDTGFHQK
jgi:uncharacterized phage infection (PIP) family protein YhgE